LIVYLPSAALERAATASAAVATDAIQEDNASCDKPWKTHAHYLSLKN